MDRSRRPIVVCDPGHGGSDPGAVNYDEFVYEDELNLDLALLFMVRAKPYFDVLLTRVADVTVPLEERAALSNVCHPDAFVSFHANAAEDKTASGFEVWTTPGDTPADALASAIFAALGKACPDRNGRAGLDDGDADREANFYVLRHTKCPAVLVEFGFLTNDEEARWMSDVANQFTLVEAVVEGVRFWLEGRPQHG